MCRRLWEGVDKNSEKVYERERAGVRNEKQRKEEAIKTWER